jgi:Cu/Ag efflux pump CusA
VAPNPRISCRGRADRPGDAGDVKARQHFVTCLSQASLPQGVQPALSPDGDATGEILRHRTTPAAPERRRFRRRSGTMWPFAQGSA